MEHLGDVTKINGAEIEPVDIISFGSPCQDMSVAGKRAGLEGSRSGLFMEAVRIIKEMREATNGKYPRFAIWENVPGAFSSNGGNDFRAVLEEITETEIPMPSSGKWAEAGMVRGNERSVAWRVLDAQYWGVPQRRKRIFLVADFRGQRAGEILFEQEGVSGHPTESREAWEEVATCAGDGIKTTSRVGFAMQAIGEYADTGKSSTIKQRDYKDATDLVVCLNDTGGQWFDISHNVAPTPVIAFNGRQDPISGPVAGALDTCHPQAQCVAVDVRNLSETVELSGTLQSKNSGGYSLNYQNPVRIGYRVRRLTPTECLRLQGFHDWWLNIEGASDSAKYKSVGNSVAIPCVDFIFKQIVTV